MLDRGGVRSLAAIIGMVAVVGLMFGLTGPLLNLILEEHGVPGGLIGLNAAMVGLGALVIMPFVPRLVQRFGALQLNFFSLAGTALSLLAFKLSEDYFAWLAVRFVMGVAIVILFVVSEVWVNQLADNTNRGRLLGIYTSGISVGFGCGPLLITFTGTHGWTPFLAGVGLIGIAAISISLAGKNHPTFEKGKPAPLWHYFRASPVALTAGVIYGAVETGVFGLLPVFGVNAGLTETLSASLLTAVAAGNIVLQYPVGWIADRTRPLHVLLGCAAIGVIGAASLPFAIGTPFVWPLLFVWGGTITGVYTIALTMLGHQYNGLALAGANSALIAAYNLGSLGGLPFLGQSMEIVMPDGFGYGIALIFLAFLLFGISRRDRDRPPGAPI